MAVVACLLPGGLQARGHRSCGPENCVSSQTLRHSLERAAVDRESAAHAPPPRTPTQEGVLRRFRWDTTPHAALRDEPVERRGQVSLLERDCHYKLPLVCSDPQLPSRSEIEEWLQPIQIVG